MRAFLREYVAVLLTPTPVIGLLLLIGVILLLAKRDKFGKPMVIAGTFLFCFFSYDPFTEWFLNSFENKYPAFSLEKAPPGIKYVVVLAGGYTPYEGHPLTSELTSYTLPRVVEGVKILNEIPDSILIVTGKGWAALTEAKAMRKLAVSLGVPFDRVIIEEKSQNTIDHPYYLEDLLGKKPFVLVTSALHMPRAMALFESANLKPIPAPTGHILLGEYEIFNMKIPFSTGDNLAAIDAYFLEFWGIVWGRLSGKIGDLP